MPEEHSKEKINALFDDCHSNLETPLTGRVFAPICYGCKNRVDPEDWFAPFTCSVYGTPPRKYSSDDKEQCPHKIEE